MGVMLTFCIMYVLPDSENFFDGVNNTLNAVVEYVKNSRKRNRISFFIGLDFKVLTRRGSRETAALVI